VLGVVFTRLRVFNRRSAFAYLIQSSPAIIPGRS